MRLVGASNGFIRGPFLMEGALHAIIGSLLAVGVAGASAQRWRCRSCRPRSSSCTLRRRACTTFMMIYAALVVAGLVIGLTRLGAGHASLPEGVAGRTDATAHEARRQQRPWRKPARSCERNRHLARALGLVIVVAVAFVAGFFVRGESAFLAGLGFPVDSPRKRGLRLRARRRAIHLQLGVGARQRSGGRAGRKTAWTHYDLDAATAQTARARCTASTEDGYLRYYDPARYAALRQGEFGRLVFRHRRAVLRIQRAGVRVDVFEGSVAEAAGRAARATSWWPSTVTAPIEWSLTEAVNGALARGGFDRGGHVDAAVLAGGGRRARSSRRRSNARAYSVPNVTTELAGTVGYIKLKQITQNADDLVRQGHRRPERAGRDLVRARHPRQPGRLPHAGREHRQPVREERRHRGGRDARRSRQRRRLRRPVATEAPLVVLVNGYTAAAAEVLAAALQDNQRAHAGGHARPWARDRCRWCASCRFGGALRYTAAYYKSPLGHDINDVGVLPDMTVAAGGDAASDAQKRLALETAESLVQG